MKYLFISYSYKDFDFDSKKFFIVNGSKHFILNDEGFEDFVIWLLNVLSCDAFTITDYQISFVKDFISLFDNINFN